MKIVDLVKVLSHNDKNDMYRNRSELTGLY